MKKRNIIKMLILGLIVLVCTSIISSGYVLAKPADEFGGVQDESTTSDIIKDVDEWDPSKAESPNSSSFNYKINMIIGIVRNIGVVASVVTLAILGIKYMVSSIEEKADFKIAMKGYLIGAVMLFAGTTITQIIYVITKNIT